MAPTERCETAREIQRIRLHLAALQELIDELEAADAQCVRISDTDQPVPVAELLARCLSQRDDVRRELVQIN